MPDGMMLEPADSYLKIRPGMYYEGEDDSNYDDAFSDEGLDQYKGDAGPEPKPEEKEKKTSASLCSGSLAAPVKK